MKQWIVLLTILYATRPVETEVFVCGHEGCSRIDEVTEMPYETIQEQRELGESSEVSEQSEELSTDIESL